MRNMLIAAALLISFFTAAGYYFYNQNKEDGMYIKLYNDEVEHNQVTKRKEKRILKTVALDSPYFGVLGGWMEYIAAYYPQLVDVSKIPEDGDPYSNLDFSVELSRYDFFVGGLDGGYYIKKFEVLSSGKVPNIVYIERIISGIYERGFFAVFRYASIDKKRRLSANMKIFNFDEKQPFYVGYDRIVTSLEDTAYFKDHYFIVPIYNEDMKIIYGEYEDDGTKLTYYEYLPLDNEDAQQYKLQGYDNAYWVYTGYEHGSVLSTSYINHPEYGWVVKAAFNNKIHMLFKSAAPEYYNEKNFIPATYDYSFQRFLVGTDGRVLKRVY